MKKLLFALALACTGVAPLAQAQSIVMQQDVNKDTLEGNWGPNRRHYIHRYFGLGFGVGTENRTWEGKDLKDIKYGFGTGSLLLGFRYKLRLAEHYALGLDLGYNRQTFNFKQRDDKVFPTSGKNDKERLILHNLALEAYQRINFGKRGDHLGNYVDLGAFVEWNFDNTLLIKNDNDTANFLGAKKEKLKFKNLNYLEDFNYGVSARVGTGRFALFGRYRLSDMLIAKKVENYPELPRLTTGLQVRF